MLPGCCRDTLPGNHLWFKTLPWQSSLEGTVSITSTKGAQENIPGSSWTFLVQLSSSDSSKTRGSRKHGVQEGPRGQRPLLLWGWSFLQVENSTGRGTIRHHAPLHWLRIRNKTLLKDTSLVGRRRQSQGPPTFCPLHSAFLNGDTLRWSHFA